MNTIKVDFSKQTGKIKPLHGVCCAPYSKRSDHGQPYIEKHFNEASIPYCRLHDCCGGYGGTYFVDISNVFPNFSADENDPESYDFYYTDEYIKAIQDNGCETYYRLGETIEWGSKKYRTRIPVSYEKWARICEHIVMHYNEGWANGFHYNLKYWEIWNEPENPGDAGVRCQWGETNEDFYRLYEVASKLLKSRFPDIKIGGYGSCGFYAVSRENPWPASKEFVKFFVNFLEMVKATNSPLDFFSWHIYTLDIKELLINAKYVRETLDKYGFTKTESHLNEWNISDEGTGFDIKHTEKAAAFLTSVMCMLQNTNYVDMAMYYCFSLLARYNGILNQNDLSVSPPWYAFVAFGELYRLKNEVYVEVDSPQIQAAAARCEGNGAIIISNYESEDETVALNIKSDKPGRVNILKLTGDGLTEEISITISENSKMNFKVKKNSFVLLTMSNN